MHGYEGGIEWNVKTLQESRWLDHDGRQWGPSDIVGSTRCDEGSELIWEGGYYIPVGCVIRDRAELFDAALAAYRKLKPRDTREVVW